jgi:apolipoprotein N-acyltransferase
MRFDLTAGARVQRFATTIQYDDSGASRTLTMATPICFESSVAGACRRLVHHPVEGVGPADLLLTMTNDGWFGDDPGGRERHFQIGRFRCIENRVPMLHSANTGVSGAIDSTGRVVAYGPTYPANTSAKDSWGGAVATLALDGRWTLFSIVGDSFGWLCSGLTILLTAIGILRMRTRRRREISI